MIPDYLIQNETSKNPPKNNVWVVYSINVGPKKYIGLTNNFNQRMYDHLRSITKLISLSSLPYFIAANYGKFCPSCIRTYGVRFEIEAYPEEREEARIIESRLIIEAATKGIELNKYVPKYRRSKPAKEKADCFYYLGTRVDYKPRLTCYSPYPLINQLSQIASLPNT